jgi:exopolysaccharide biosynthesis polyprenyl glycosylphosphotransferase
METPTATYTGPVERSDPAPLAAAPASRRARPRSSVLGRALLAADLIGTATAATVAAIAVGSIEGYAISYVGAAALTWAAFAFTIGMYGNGDDLRAWASGVPELPRTLATALACTWPLYLLAWILDLPAPVALAGLTAAGAVVATGVARALARAALHNEEELRQRTVILGSGVVAGHIVQKIKSHPQFGLLPVGMVDDDVHAFGSPDLPVLGGFSDLRRILAEHQPDRVIIAFSRASHEELLQCMRACRDHGVSIDVVPRLFEFLDGVRALDHLGGLPVLSIGTPRLSRSSQIAKRALDIAVAGGALIAMLPLLMVIAIAIKLDSRGPLLFRQQRSGRGREVFELLKFRSMYVGSDERKPELASDNDLTDGVMFKMHADPRVTRVGRILRRYSLDEVPQLWNVVRGQMSLVGPRPLILPETDALAEAWHLRRLELRPGLTGPWQINGRSQTPFHEMVRFDYQYVAGWSLARDIEILLATLPAVISGRGAY